MDSRRSNLIQRFLLLMGAAAVLTVNVAADELDDAVRSAIDQVSSSVVRIQIVGHPDRAGRIGSHVTTGVVVSESGEIVSSSFGFGGDTASVFVQAADGERYAAEVVATDQVRKLVLLQTNASGLRPPVWAEESPAVGAWAIAVGRFYPVRLPSASLGIISALNRVHGLAIQTDAKVSPVNYGGPLLTLDGSVAGILVPLSPGNDATGVTAGVGWYDSGIGFAISAADVADSVHRLRAGEDRLHGLLGIRPSTQNPLATDVVVETVQPRSPAEAAGIQPGDRILAVNGQPTARVGILQSALRSSWAGDTVVLNLQRDDAELMIEATLTDELEAPERGWLGIVPLETAAADESESEGPAVDDGDTAGQGVRAGILSRSAAAEAGLPQRCLIFKVDGKEIGSMGDLRRRLRDLTAGVEHEITFAPLDGEAEPQSVAVTATAVSEEARMEWLSAVAALRQETVTATLPPWVQSVKDLDEERHVWILGPSEKLSGVEPGIVLLLHDGEPVADALVQQWADVCQQHQLILAVVYHEYSIPLDSVQVLGEVLSDLTRLGSPDLDRITLVTTDSHASLVTRVLLDPRIAPLNQAVFVDCRPVTAGASLLALQQKRVSMLLFPDTGDLQTQALTASSVRRMRTAGAAVTVREDGEKLSGRQRAREIARWMLLEKIR